MWKLIWIFFVLSSINWAWWLGKLSSSPSLSLPTLLFSSAVCLMCSCWMGRDITRCEYQTTKQNALLSFHTTYLEWNIFLLWNPFLFPSLLCMCSYCEWHNIYISVRTWQWTCILMWGYITIKYTPTIFNVKIFMLSFPFSFDFVTTLYWQ